jgi:putative inorganic carbon (HCO3(-)) transporter
MEFYQNSFILSLIVRFWDAVTACFKNSLLYRLCCRIRDLFRDTLLMWLGSHEGTLSRSWEDSLFCHLVIWCMNLVPNLLHWLYTKAKVTADRSLLCRRVLPFLGRCTLPVLGVMMFALLIIPQQRWDNRYSLMAVVFALLLFWLSGANDREQRLGLREIGPWPVLFAFTICLSFLWSKQPSLSLRFLGFGVTCMILVVLLVSAVRNSKQLLGLIACCAAGLFLCCLYAFGQRLGGLEADEVLTDLSLNANMPGRVYSFFENPNSFANILVFFAPLMLTMAFFSPKVWYKLGFAVVFGLCCGALLMTYSRGGWLALAFALFILMLLLCPRWVPLLLVLGFVAVPFLPDSILSRFLTIFNTSDSSIYTRGYIYSAMVRIIGQNWFFGVGLGAEALKYAIECSGVYHASALFVHAHNIYMQIWAESGLFAILAFVCTMFLPMRAGTRRLRQGATPLLRGVIAGCISGLAGSLLFGVTDYAWSYPRVMVMFWFVFALLLAAVKLAGKNTKQEAVSHGTK